MTINQIAHAVFDSFASTDIVLAILNHNGSYVANKLDVFEEVFSDQRLLDELCRRVNDGQEPVISQIDGFFVAAAGLSNGFEQVGYAIILLPAESFGHIDFIEIILEQFSTIAGLIEQNQQLKDSIETEKTIFDMPALTSVN